MTFLPTRLPENGASTTAGTSSAPEIPDWTPSDSILDDPWVHIGRTYEHACRLLHYRDKDQVEVDIVLETGSGQVAGFEVKAAASVNAADFAGLRKLRQAAGDNFIGGMVLHDGAHVASFGGNLHAVPFSALWTP